jgi:glycosyltransferase involved in cell wall biosynthesis
MKQQKAIKSEKKALILSTFDSNGGASELTYRMAKALKNNGFQVEMLVRFKTTNKKYIHVLPAQKLKNPLSQRLIKRLKKYCKVTTPKFDPNPDYAFFPGEDESKQYASLNEILNAISFIPNYVFSGLTYGFVNTSLLSELHLATGAIIYQVMYDMSILTGGCHVIWKCKGLENCCSGCPAIKDKYFSNYTKTNHNLKKKNLVRGNFNLLHTRGWSIKQANISSLYKDRKKVAFNIPVDLNLFTDKHRNYAKGIFNIEKNTKVIFAGSSNFKDRRKGGNYLLQSLELLWEKLDKEQRESICILFAGNIDPENSELKNIKFKNRFLGFIKDYRLLSLVYQAADIFVCPSIEDAGPMMIAESLACGTPVVGFKMGFLFDESYVVDGYNGYKASLENQIELMEAMRKIIILSDDDRLQMFRNARNSAMELFSESQFVKSIDIL